MHTLAMYVERHECNKHTKTKAAAEGGDKAGDEWAITHKALQSRHYRRKGSAGEVVAGIGGNEDQRHEKHGEDQPSRNEEHQAQTQSRAQEAAHGRAEGHAAIEGHGIPAVGLAQNLRRGDISYIGHQGRRKSRQPHAKEKIDDGHLQRTAAPVK